MLAEGLVPSRRCIRVVEVHVVSFFLFLGGAPPFLPLPAGLPCSATAVKLGFLLAFGK